MAAVNSLGGVHVSTNAASQAGKTCGDLPVDRVDRLVNRHDLPLPFGLELLPSFFFLSGQGDDFLLAAFGDPPLADRPFAVELSELTGLPRLDMVELCLEDSVDLFNNPGRLRFELFPRLAFKFRFDFVGPAPLALNLRARLFMLLLQALVLLLAPGRHRGARGDARVDDPAGLPQRLRNGNRRRFGLGQAEMVDEPGDAENRRGGAAGNGAGGCRESEIPGKPRRPRQQEQKQHRKRGVPENARQQKPVERGELLLRLRKMSVKPLERVARCNLRRRNAALFVAKHPPKGPIDAEIFPGAALEKLKVGLIGFQVRDKTGVSRIGFRGARGHLPLRRVISHLQIAHPPPLRFLGQHRKIAKARVAKALGAGAARFVDRPDPFLLRLEESGRLGGLRGITRFRPLHFGLVLLVRRVAPAVDLAGELFLPLGESRNRLLQGRKEFEVAVDPQIDVLIHNRS